MISAIKASNILELIFTFTAIMFIALIVTVIVAGINELALWREVRRINNE